MSTIKVSDIDDEPTEMHEPDVSAGTVEPQAPKPKRVRTKPQPKAQEPLPPPPAPIEKQRKQGKMTTCTNCNKELLEKTFKYYHQLKCKPKEPANTQPTKPEAKPETISVDFNFHRRAQKQERYTSLFSNAV